MLDSVITQVDGLGKVETQARLEGRNMTMVLAPEKKAPVKKERPAGEPATEADTEAAPTEAVMAPTEPVVAPTEPVVAPAAEPADTPPVAVESDT